MLWDLLLWRWVLLVLRGICFFPYEIWRYFSWSNNSRAYFSESGCSNLVLSSSIMILNLFFRKALLWELVKLFAIELQFFPMEFTSYNNWISASTFQSFLKMRKEVLRFVDLHVTEPSLAAMFTLPEINTLRDFVKLSCDLVPSVFFWHLTG